MLPARPAQTLPRLDGVCVAGPVSPHTRPVAMTAIHGTVDLVTGNREDLFSAEVRLPSWLMTAEADVRLMSGEVPAV